MTDAAPRIDVHNHVIPAFYQEAVYRAGRGPALGKYPEWNPELALGMMDRFGIELAITSLAQPGVGFLPPREGESLARQCNEYAAEMIVRRPRRFGAFATMPMKRMEGAIEELRYCVDELDFDGVALFASYDELFLGDSYFEPLFRELNERSAIAFLHPGLHPSSRTLSLPWPGFMMEYLFDTTRAVVNLIFSGTLERFPRIRFILPHAGGVVPYFAWRLAVSPMIDARLPRLSPDQVFSSLAKFWYDTALSPSVQTFGALVNVARRDRILFGSDFPFANLSVVAEEVKGLEGGFLSARDRAAIERSNALELFPRYAQPADSPRT